MYVVVINEIVVNFLLNESEIELVKLILIESEVIFVLGVKEVNIWMECVLECVILFGGMEDLLVCDLLIGCVVCFYVVEYLYEKGCIYVEGFKLISCLVGYNYVKLGE